MKALRRFTVRAHLPERLAALERLSINLRWSWHKPTQDLFAELDPELWQQTNGDPVALLGAVSPRRLDELAGDEAFLNRLDELAADLDNYLSRPLWYQQQIDDGVEMPKGIAYFSMEFGVAEVLPNYSGGLGILAGDHLKSASDLGLPLIAVGLYYRSGYFRQSLTADGWQHETYPSLDPQGLPLRLLTDASGAPVLVELALPDARELRARVWIAQVGRVPLLLLDADVPENEHELRGVTDRLYGGDQEHRIKQEILAGIGGVRAIRAFTEIENLPAPEVFHMNEGHAGFLGAERIRELVAAGLDFDTALTVVRSSTVFTTHTPVPAGIDRFPVEMIRRYFGSPPGGPADSRLLPGVPLERVIAFGAEDDPSKFNMAHMGLRLAQRANGVSLLHGRVSRAMFNDLWPGFDRAEVPIGSITNGVHAPTWAAPQWLALGRELIGSEAAEPAVWERLQEVDPGHMWWIRSQLRETLIADVRDRLRRSWLERGASEAELGWIATAFDPSVLTVGFARRVPTYKRLTLMLRDPERLEKLLLDEKRPVQLIVAGKSHPADDGGKALIQQIVRFADRPEVRHRIAFLPDYDMSMARLLYWGCDVWLNNPLRPLEACGTSGMKSALNGGLNLSIRDGWWDEWYDGENGWEIPTADGVDDEARRDDLEAAALYDLLEHAVTPKFYERDEHGVPTRWVEMVRHTLQVLGPKVLASRMVRDYTEKYYLPAAQSLRETVEATSGEPFGAARQLADYRRRAQDAWPKIQITDVDSYGLPDTPLLGSQLTLTATVQLAGLRPDEVTVQAVLGRVDAGDVLVNPVTVTMAHTGSAEGDTEVFSTSTPLPVAGPVGYTVRVLPHHRLLTADNELGLVTLA
ncbi:glycosyltransferase family 1 protein [Mycolicibacterium fortuitum]|uniref:glycogen phosphorylase n=1 Tax=Mycolicibacterium fortuitum subsp. fortuitum DSM 46621 = ATCC 6841 = JCM 6387 TaxID=1214102 RepID=K0VJI1_MYCFO|nr:glycosyltransferase family 1 protein [Mycolicibacterium fortuitum]AIY47658.1 Glycogen phosphorylase [Mycobacterium sp. VKM Ac-1817D]CRL82166.1 alpha-glucan phosphorylase [Mycolicibacter nonchromogenicus]AMD55430.1 glycogen phosphorylase [Mycolicibacterium fortuitum subsp. fortuitum DSM 46621 = ATCC 6841 = JCM 6387]EJZ15063.1 alpha-glucan phosphorylase [Mycolicibacterium fortuitum subsp. fortuitum DSM 46621 = ATCC 6841 = JCM 6387]MCA4756471.1 glycosyltransferase family 1 protein [Mycolicibac